MSYVMTLRFQEIVSLGEEAHLNTSFKHFVYFIQEFELIDKKELAPLQELIDRLTSGSAPEWWSGRNKVTHDVL